MGCSEYAKASICIKILLSDRIQQINKGNWDLSSSISTQIPKSLKNFRIDEYWVDIDELRRTNIINVY